MELIKIERPSMTGFDKSKALDKFSNPEVYAFIQSLNEPEYAYWDSIKYKTPPQGISIIEAWYIAQQLRKFSAKRTYLLAEDGQPFIFYRLPSIDEHLHKIDMHAGGQMFADYSTIARLDRQKFISRGILEEAIASSQLEGANTTRKVAKQMILENRAPRNKSELMIINNYKAMKSLEDRFSHQPMSRDLLLEIHRILTDGDLQKNDQGRFRVDADDIVVMSRKEGFISHIPPAQKFLDSQLDRLIKFANDEDSQSFTHPIIKAIFLHFWIGYLHPFVDGNGRLARTLFYWYLLRKGYWTFMFLPISVIIKKSPMQYESAYVYTEQDGYDLTYFYDYHITKILRAINDFGQFCDKIVRQNKEIERFIGDEPLNDRQKQILHYLISEGEGAYVTIQSHMTINNIARLTARNDLKKLEALGYLKEKKVGLFRRFSLTDKLEID